MPDDVKIGPRSPLLASQYIERTSRPWSENVKIQFRGSAFTEYTNPMTTDEARAIFTYGLALCDEIDDPPRVWEDGALYASIHMPTMAYRRENNGWLSLSYRDSFFADGDPNVSEFWLDDLVRLVPETTK